METLSYLPGQDRIVPGPPVGPPPGTTVVPPGTVVVPPGGIGGLMPQGTPPIQPPTSPEMPGKNNHS